MKLLKNLYFNNTFFWLIGGNIVLLIIGQYFPLVHSISKFLLVTITVVLITDIAILFNKNSVVKAQRYTTEKLSNGDKNEILITIKNFAPFVLYVRIIDELPKQFQKRDFCIKTKLDKGEEKTFNYSLKPLERGEYHFGRLVVFTSQSFNLVSRRFIIHAEKMIPVYPSFIQMRKYELLAISNKLTEAGIKKLRKKGHQMEFDHIRDYVRGDDYRTINWKATARKSGIMVNQYQDERSQQVYSLIDMGRAMEMPFGGMTLLDYAINASLVISNIALLKHDKAGLITFTEQINSMIPAERKSGTITKISKILYNQSTHFLESNFELLYTTVRSKIKQRSLLLLFTNFESLFSMERYLYLLQSLNKNHLLVVIFFENTEVISYLKKPVHNTEDIYMKTISEKLIHDKKHIVKYLEKYGIHSILTEPKNLTVDTINKYLQLKSIGAI